MSRRTLAGSTVVLALVATATLTPAPSYAVLVEPNVRSQGGVYPGYESGCTLSASTDDDNDGTFTDDGGWASQTSNAGATVTDPEDAADRSVLSSTTTTQVRATSVAGSLGVLEVRVGSQLTKAADQGTASSCKAYASSSGGVSTGIVLATPGWLTIDLAVETGASTYEDGQVALASAQYAAPDLTVRAAHGRSSTRVFRAAGAYQLDADLGLNYSGIGTRTGTLAATITFAPVGSASTAAAGAGRKYVALPDQITCAGGTAELQLPAKGKALKKLTKGVFTGTGAKTVKLKKLKPGRKVALGGLAMTGPVTLAAAFTKKNGKVVEVERSYTPCG